MVGPSHLNSEYYILVSSPGYWDTCPIFSLVDTVAAWGHWPEKGKRWLMLRDDDKLESREIEDGLEL